MRHLIFDGQVLQTPAFHRGMGKYSIELIKALTTSNTKRKEWDKIIVIISSRLSTTEATKALGFSHDLEVVRLDLCPNEIGNQQISRHNREIVTQYFENLEYDKADYIILSLLQGEIYPTFPKSKNVRKCVLYYDLIPLIFHDIYLGNPITRMEYLSKIAELLRADTYFGISATTSNDLALYLGIDASRVVNIDGGPIEHSTKTKILDVPKPFILMPTGNDLRKNNERGILGFAEFNALRGNKFSLVITSYFKDFEVEHLLSLAPNVVFTGNITGEELNYLYQKAEALLFPTEYEGLGLPILEALQTRKPIACSDIPVFRELTKTACTFFDPKSINEIAQALSGAIDNNTSMDVVEYERVVNTYTWDRTAQKVISSLLEAPLQLHAYPKKKLAVFGANPTGSSMPAKFMLENHAELSRCYNVTYFLNNNVLEAEKRINYLPYITPVNILGSLQNLVEEEYVSIIYHIDGTSASAPVLFTALAIPGVAVLHSLNLDNVWQELVSSKFVDSSRVTLEKNLDKSFADSKTQLLVSLLQAQRAVIVFSEKDQMAVVGILSAINHNVPVVVAPMATSSLPYPEILPERKASADGDELSLEVILSEATKDYEAYDRMSHLKEVSAKVTTSYDPLEVLEALRFGVSTNGYRIAPGSSRESSSLELIEFINKHHTQRLFIERLNDVIEQLNARV